MKKINLTQKIKSIDFRALLEKTLDKLELIGYGIVVVLILGFSFFLYNNFYLTITSEQEVVIIDDATSNQVINQTLIERVTKKYNEKKATESVDWSSFTKQFEGGTQTVQPVVEANPQADPATNNPDSVSPGGF